MGCGRRGVWGEGGREGEEREGGRERESGAGRGSTRQSRVKKRESATACQAIIGAASATTLGKTSERGGEAHMDFSDRVDATWD